VELAAVGVGGVTGAVVGEEDALGRAAGAGEELDFRPVGCPIETILFASTPPSVTSF